MTFDARASAVLEYLEAVIQAAVSARRLVLELALQADDGPSDDLPELPEE